MLAEIMHHCVFLIITFSWHGLCIQNGRSVMDAVEATLRNPNAFPEARQSSFHPSDPDNTGFVPIASGGFSFPDKYQHNHQYQANSRNELHPTYEDNTNPYPNNQQANNNQRANPHNLALNTGEYSGNANNNRNNYPYQQNTNAIASFTQRLSPAIPNANDNYLTQQAASRPDYHSSNYKFPNYPPPRFQTFPQPKPIYAEAYDNYLYNRQPNYNQRATPPPAPSPIPPPRPISHYPPPQASSYGGASYQDGHLTPPYRNDLAHTPTTYPFQYANQFGNFILPFGQGSGTGTNPLGSLLNTIGVPFAGGGNPLSMQIIDGLEKIARNDDLQCVPKVLCQMLGSPTRRAQLPSFITSPVLTSFIASLPSSSPALIYGRAALLGLSGGDYSCARTYSRCPQNEDDILYYLNNHRGGFFKFFSEPGSKPVLDPHQQYTASPTTATHHQSQPSIFNFLTGFASSPTTTTTTNTDPNQGNLNTFMSNAVTNGIGSLFGNILSGFLSGQTATRRILTNIQDNEEDKSESEVDSATEEVEGRILNNKSNLLKHIEPIDNPISFPTIESGSGSDDESTFRFPTTSLTDVDDQRGSKKVNFIESNPRPVRGGTKMIFPDRTGTGNLRFDNDEFFRVGKIINRPDYDAETTTTRTRKKSYSTAFLTDGSLDRYLSSNYRKDSGQTVNRIKGDDTTGNIYVTNSHGITEYYINPKGQKVYL